jgi:lipopolysaccharide heptosyltransferase II
VVPLADLERIYVRLPNWVGDVLLATPFLMGLRRAAPQAEVVAHGKAHNLRLLSHEGLWTSEVVLGPRGRGARRWAWPWREGRRVRLEAGPCDLAVLLPNSFSSALVARAVGARHRVGYGLNGRSWLLTETLPVQKTGRLRPIPMVDYYLGLLTALGASTDGLPRRPVLSSPPGAAEEAKAFLESQGIGPADRVWAINVGGSWETKRWIPEHAGKLARALRERGQTPLMLWGPGEEGLAARAREAAGGELPGAGAMVPLRSLLAVLERCEMMVTTDSGPRHFGIAAGIPVIVVVGSTHPGYTHVDYPDYRILCEEVDCWPCHLKHCPIDFRCMHLLTANRVMAAGDQLLADTAARSAGGAP